MMDLVMNREQLIAKLREPVPDGIHGYHPDERSVAAANAIELYHKAWTSEQAQHAAWRKRADEAESQLAAAHERAEKADRERDEARNVVAATVQADPRQLWNVAATELAQEVLALRAARDQLAAENAKLREALEWYANEAHWGVIPGGESFRKYKQVRKRFCWSAENGPDIARAALAQAPETKA